MSILSEPQVDLVVVGGGVTGIWSAISAAKRGASVILAEQFDRGHTNGSSHGDSRVYRLAYSDDKYIDMMLTSLQMWHQLQSNVQRQLLSHCGCLTFSPLVDGHPSPEICQLLSVYQRRSISHVLLSAEDLQTRFPQFHSRSDWHALFIPEAGVLFADECMTAAQSYACSLGVQVLAPFCVYDLRRDQQKQLLQVISSDGRVLRTKSVVLAPGPWLSTLSSTLLGLDLRTVISAETVCYYRPHQGSPDHTYNSMPVWFLPKKDDNCGLGYYGLPQVKVGGIKVATHHNGPEVCPSFLHDSNCSSQAENEHQKGYVEQQISKNVQETNQFVQDMFPHVEPYPIKVQNCLYTTTADHDFVIGAAPGWNGKVVIVGGGSGHAFKMAPAIGSCAAALAIGKTPPLPVGEFSVERLLNRNDADHAAVFK